MESVSIMSEEFAKQFAGEFGSSNLEALYTEYHYHIEYGENLPDLHDAKFLVALYSAVHFGCIADSEVGDLKIHNVLQWTYDEVFYGYIGEAVDKTAAEIGELFQAQNYSDNYVAHNEDEDEEEEEEEEETLPSRARSGINQFDYLLEP